MRNEVIERTGCVRTWLTSVAARGTGSPGTREVYIDRLAYFLKWSRLDPDGLIALAKAEPVKVKNLLNEMIVAWEKKGRSRQYTSATFRTVISFLRENEVQMAVRGPKVFTRSKKRTVTIEEIRRLMQFANLRLRAFVACMKDCGMAPIDLLQLKYGDIRKDLEAGKVPIRISRIRHKTRQEFETFLGPDAVEYLGYYLDARRRGTEKIPPEKLDDSSPLFAGEVAGAFSDDALRSNFWRISKNAQTEWRLYDLRKFFSTNLKASGVNDTLVEWWMGHKLSSSIDPYFFSPENQESIYMGAYPRISLKEERDLEKLRKEQLLDTARMLRVSPELIEKIRQDIYAGQTLEEAADALGLSLEERIRGMAGSLAERFFLLPTEERERIRGKAMEEAGSKEKRIQDKVVPKKDLQSYLEDGWTFVSALDGDVIVRRSGP